MTSNRPYLIRAIYQWLLDNDTTPQLLVATDRRGVVVPPQHVKDGQILFNISPSAVRGLELGNDWITFSARFGGAAMNVRVPVDAVLALYSRENGQGMLFPQEEPEETAVGAGQGEDGDTPQESDPPRPPRGRPNLKVVK
jgi:stringent starvation protein B